MNRAMKRLPLAIFSMMLLTMILWLAPGLAQAQAATPNIQFQIVQDDYFLNVILKGVLGPIINPNGASAQQTITDSGTMGDIFRVFNLGVAFFGSLIVVFITVVGVLQSGNDGEFLGRRWSSMWVPVRFTAGSALMLPLTNSGYSFCQAMVLWIATQGIGFADTLWTKIVEKVIVKNGMTITAEMGVQNVLRQMALSEICVAAVNKYSATPNFSFRPGETYSNSVSAPTTTIQFSWGDATTPLFGNDATNMRQACGGMSYSFMQNTAVTSVNDDPYIQMRGNIGAEHRNQIIRFQPEYARLAFELVNAYAATADAGSDPTPILQQLTTQIEQDTQAYTQAMANRISAEVAGTTLGANQANNANHMTQYGFAMAGVWYMELTKVHNAARQSLKAPEYTPMNVTALATNPSWSSMKTALDASFVNFQSAFANTGTAMTTGNSTAGAVQAKTVSFDMNPADFIGSGWLSNLSAKLSNFIISSVFGVGAYSTGETNSVYNIANGGNQDPNVSSILQLKDKGDTILDAAGILVTMDIMNRVAIGAKEGSWLASAGAAASRFTVAGDVVQGGMGILKELSVYFVMLGSALFALGLTLSVIIPMIPYTLWIAGIIGLVVLVLEGLVAIMLWAVMLMHPSGEGITSQYNTRGLNMLMAVFMRPSLMLMGYVTGMFMLEPLVMFINDGFSVAMKSVQANTISGLFSIIAFMSIYVSMILLVVDKSFAMIHVLPDRVLEWIGGPGALTGEDRDAKSNAYSMGRTVAGQSDKILLANIGAKLKGPRHERPGMGLPGGGIKR